MGIVTAIGAVVGISVAVARSERGKSAPATLHDGGGAAASPDPIAPLHAFEEARRRAADFAHLPPSDRALGPDPVAVRVLPGDGPPRFVGLLRGRDALVLLDASLHELSRAPTPPLPTGLSVAEDGRIAVSAEQDAYVATYFLNGDTLVRGEGGHWGGRRYVLRDVALAGPDHGLEYLVDELKGELLAVASKRGENVMVPVGHGAFRVARAGQRLVVDCLLEHTLEIFDLDAHGLPVPASRATIHHDGPIWGFDAQDTPGGLLIAAGGVEDHPLDRTQGSFAFIDSFVYVYLVPRGGRPERLAAVNVSEHGVVTPKAVVLRVSPEGARTVYAAGYGSDKLAEIHWPAGYASPPSVRVRTILPGVASMALAGDTLVFADPLLDAWFSLPPEGDATPVPLPVPDPDAPPRSTESRVGEALFFTNLMAPWNSSEGRLSRFTCETCHFEGYVDGRIHSTGRGDVHATTKPLLGLFENRPHFSRALDPDMATMVNNEFRVAGSLSGHDPWFSMAEAALPWTHLLGEGAAKHDALGLRRALMTFLMDFNHRPNPAVIGRDALTDEERRGMALFEQRCERCHAARLVADDPATRVPEERWPSMVLTREGPIVWGSSGYWKTGVEPYVHEEGARTPSLRRLYKKWPYFTNGSAKGLADVLARVRFHGESFWHDGAPEGAEGLGEKEREALLAWLDLL